MFAQLRVAGLISGISERSLQQVKIGYIFWNMSGQMLYENVKSLLTTLFNIKNIFICQAIILSQMGEIHQSIPQFSSVNKF